MLFRSMSLPADALAAAALVVLFGYLVFGITGFGASLFTVPVLSHFLPLPFVLAVALLLDVTAAATLGLRYRRDVALGEIVPLLPFAAIGAVLGVTLLVKLPREACLLAMGIFLLCHGLMGLRAKGTLARVSRWWAAPAGFAGGLFGTLFGVGGPPQIAYLSRRPMGSEQLRATNEIGRAHV